jgi:hypothetical protein
MKRVGSLRTVADIEFIIEAPSLGDARSRWRAHGAECSRGRHRFSGVGYAFIIEVLELRMVNAGRTLWHVMIVTEWWRSADPDADIRSTKWLKVLQWKASDFMAWLRRCRAGKLEGADRPHAAGAFDSP